METFISIGVVGLAIMIGGVWWLTLSSEGSDNSFQVFLSLAFKILIVAFGLSMQFAGIGGISQELIYKKLTKEVNLEQVAVKGKSLFNFDGEIVFNNGEIESIILKNGTTKKEEKVGLGK